MTTKSPEERLRELAIERGLAVEKLTINQFVEALRQAIAAGDFQRNIQVDGGAQAVYYLPYREASALRANVERLTVALKKIEECCDKPSAIWDVANAALKGELT